MVTSAMTSAMTFIRMAIVVTRRRPPRIPKTNNSPSVTGGMNGGSGRVRRRSPRRRGEKPLGAVCGVSPLLLGLQTVEDVPGQHFHRERLRRVEKFHLGGILH